METTGNSIVDVGSVVEAISTDNEDAPLYQIESLCMRCGENVCSHSVCVIVCNFPFVLSHPFCSRIVEVSIIYKLQARLNFHFRCKNQHHHLSLCPDLYVGYTRIYDYLYIYIFYRGSETPYKKLLNVKYRVYRVLIARLIFFS